jgi:hypothetical protein
MIFDKIWKLQWQRKRIDAAYKKGIRAAENLDDRQSLECQAWSELEMIDDQIRGEQTQRLQMRAKILDIPIPSDSESWIHNRNTGIGYLRDAIRYDLKQQIRKESKERRDYHLSLWKDILLLLTGIAAIVSSIWSIRRK